VPGRAVMTGVASMSASNAFDIFVGNCMIRILP
jgi:hypothetical protein